MNRIFYDHNWFTDMSVTTAYGIYIYMGLGVLGVCTPIFVSTVFCHIDPALLLYGCPSRCNFSLCLPNSGVTKTFGVYSGIFCLKLQQKKHIDFINYNP